MLKICNIYYCQQFFYLTGHFCCWSCASVGHIPPMFRLHVSECRASNQFIVVMIRYVKNTDISFLILIYLSSKKISNFLIYCDIFYISWYFWYIVILYASGLYFYYCIIKITRINGENDKLTEAN